MLIVGSPKAPSAAQEVTYAAIELLLFARTLGQLTTAPSAHPLRLDVACALHAGPVRLQHDCFSSRVRLHN